jgi:hypothetical protein
MRMKSEPGIEIHFMLEFMLQGLYLQNCCPNQASPGELSFTSKFTFLGQLSRGQTLTLNYRTEEGWHDVNSLFPEGFHSTTTYRSSVDPHEACTHHCYILGRDGEYWPRPTFKIVAADRPYEPLIGRSCTGAWRAVRQCFQTGDWAELIATLTRFPSSPSLLITIIDLLLFISSIPLAGLGGTGDV